MIEPSGGAGTLDIGRALAAAGSLRAAPTDVPWLLEASMVGAADESISESE